MPFPFADIRSFIADAEKEGSLQIVNGADPNLEIGGITEMVAAQEQTLHCLSLTR